MADGAFFIEQSEIKPGRVVYPDRAKAIIRKPRCPPGQGHSDGGPHKWDRKHNACEVYFDPDEQDRIRVRLEKFVGEYEEHYSKLN